MKGKCTMRTIFYAIMAIALSTPLLLAGECCPNCGSTSAVGNAAASVCPDCGQTTFLGLSIPTASLLGTGLAAVALAVGYFAARRKRRSVFVSAEPTPA